MTVSEGTNEGLFRWIASCIVLANILNLRESADIDESWLVNVNVDLEGDHPDDIRAHLDRNRARARPRMCRTDLFSKYREDMETFDTKVGNRADH
ncbi:hypothetical protein SAICODRAFT_31877 [Saitoella complicata NRRL Y-17804]|uniref:uncharacterized protein n=1 Tax=Saitoella complicata (strain BCRC 22490 / CBS 7301 / JCM 7358 / NBRC 10748 / NRRL Y-17804) TaxID=698492 RepID=UPI0008680FF3|nr:uncharacterized protein SAICODRAFT_31877 [Saitoella complicata NRRL Y-17804]ODQ50596.1 hypothetical protein SAICODRAFT_31877 [Saitoella complicata NRRL Y-17804]